ncbi:MAG: bifunctional phosphopantothenoylcysteine decarboxylase/phosphopantothenate--cysteine ligase CoaBC, partial [Bacteroidota bacterium]
AYKSAFLCRLFIKAGAEVKVIMTSAAKDFISPLTLGTLSKNPVYSDISSEEQWNNHVDIGLWADLFIVAPLTASSLSKMANGQSDNMLVATYLSAKCPVYFAPAMDLDMWKHPSTQANIQKLQSYGNKLIPVGHGELASGLVGEGRMAEPEDIVKLCKAHFQQQLDFVGKKVLITAGPTYEALDPVRYLGNPSSGKMGVAIAEELANRGAEVHLVLGPSVLNPSNSIHTLRIRSAEEMYQECLQIYPDVDVAIFAAAVADYRPKITSDKKIKKKEGDLSIELERTPDIAKSMGAIKKANQLNIGFALETNNELENAKRKIEKKNFDFIVLNSLQDKGAGFGGNTNKVKFIDQEGNIKAFELKSKLDVAADIANEIFQYIGKINVHKV